MSTSAISNYLSTSTTSSSSKTSSTDSTDGSTLDMSDFITILVAQLQNQDMNNTTDTSELVAQMAQYSMIEAMNEMKDQSVQASSFDLIGKGVTVSSEDDSGSTTSDSGVVDGVLLSNGNVKVVVNGASYSVDDVTEVFDASLLDTTTE